MADLLRDSALGFIVRLITRNKLLPYEEDRQGCQLPESYRHIYGETPNSHPGASPSETKADLEHSPGPPAQLAPGDPAKPIVPAITTDGTILVDWYSADDPANPQNWSFGKKCFVAFQICIYTFAVYIGSAIYTPSQGAVTQVFGVSITTASLGLAMYVLGYGTGPLLFAPISEIPVVGRNPPYIVTFALFVILCIPTALVNNFGGLLVLRFLQGFFGSPCLATGGASFGDIFDIFQLPFLMAFWTAAATAGPSLGPTIAGYTVQNKDWRWPLWEMIWIAGPVFILLFICLPETSASNILLRRAARLRKLTGNPKFHSQGENDQRHLTASKILIKALVRPAQIIIMDPAITFVTIYTCLTYGIYYSFFESFPLVYVEKYGFNLGEMGISFLSIVVAMLIQTPIYLVYLRHQATQLRAHGLGLHEDRLIPALIGCVLPPVGLFLFAWTSTPKIHWIASLVGVTLYNMGIFVVFQCIFIYIPLSYPHYAASLFAGNALGRSALSAGAVLFARPLFLNLGIGRGVSVLAGLTVGCIAGMYALWYWGAGLRARSRFTGFDAK
ncbi:MAG: hypothetical protein Q9173_002460 [Seirophora scorigena]